MSSQFLANLDRQLSDEQKVKFAEFVRKFYPRDYIYYEARGAFLQQNEMAGILDFVRGVGNFVSGLFGSKVQSTYQEFVNWEQTGQQPANAQNSLTAQEIINLQNKAVSDALAEERAQQNSRNLPLYAILAFLAFKVLK